MRNRIGRILVSAAILGLAAINFSSEARMPFKDNTLATLVTIEPRCVAQWRVVRQIHQEIQTQFMIRPT